MITISADTLRGLEQLMNGGEVSIKAMAAVHAGYQLGLWTYSKDGSLGVATPAIVQLLRTLPTPAEAIAALLSCEPQLRQCWQRIAADRLQELGTQHNVAELCSAIETLGQDAGAVLEQIPQSSLLPTGYSDLERCLLGVPAEQAITTPKLYRVLGSTAPFIAGSQPALPLPDVDPLDPSQNWIEGRLIQLPYSDDRTTSGLPSSVLAGYWASGELANPIATMEWVLARPWCFLLAQIVFTQEAWAAERIAGGISLELDLGNLPLSTRPPKVTVAVFNAEGEETICGSLAELLLRVLRQLGVTVFASSVDRLDSQLSPLIESLLQRRVWQFSLGSGGRRPHYTIHSTFSDTCYRALGSKYFNRLASRVTASIRSTSEQWAKERLQTKF